MLTPFSSLNISLKNPCDSDSLSTTSTLSFFFFIPINDAVNVVDALIPRMPNTDDGMDVYSPNKAKI